MDKKTQELIALWAGVALIFAIIMVVKNNSYMVLRAGFFLKLLAVIAGTLTGTVGALLGEGFRRFAQPDAVITSSTGGLIWAKLFWKAGPQLIGMFVGVAFGASMTLSLL